MCKIKYITAEGESRSRFVAGLHFPSILKIIEPELQLGNNGTYPIPLKCRTEQFIFNDEQRLKRELNVLVYDRYELTLEKPLCYIVQEIPMYYPLISVYNEYVQERLYNGSRLVGGQYFDKWADDDGEEKTCEWFACEGEDESITKEFSELHICKKGEIVQIVKDDSLTIGIVIEYCNDGSYDMWVWSDKQKCILERVPSSRVLYNTGENEIPIRCEIKEELIKRVI